MAGLGPATHALAARRRGCAGQARAWRQLLQARLPPFTHSRRFCPRMTARPWAWRGRPHRAGGRKGKRSRRRPV